MARRDPLLFADAKAMVRKPGQRMYSPQQTDIALMAVITSGTWGDATAEQLGMNVETLRSMVERNQDRLAELRERYGPVLETMAVSGLQSFVVRAEEVKGQALRAVSESITDGTCKDPAKALQAVSVAQGISVQKILELTGRPTAIVKHESVQSIIARLRALGAEVEGTSVEVPDAQVLESGPAPNATTED